MTWGAIDWKNKQIKIEQNTIYVKKKIYTKDPKTETSNRIVEIPDNVIELFKNGIENVVSLHKLRHTFATLLLAEKIQI